MDCIFCKIAKKEIPSHIVYEDAKIIAFLDINPVNKGHALVIPKQHYETFTDIPDELLKEIIIVTKKLAVTIKNKLDYTDYNIIMNNGKIAGQLVAHAHFHIQPRTANDSGHRTLKLSQEELAEIAKKLK